MIYTLYSCLYFSLLLKSFAIIFLIPCPGDPLCPSPVTLRMRCSFAHFFRKILVSSFALFIVLPLPLPIVFCSFACLFYFVLFLSARFLLRQTLSSHDVAPRMVFKIYSSHFVPSFQCLFGLKCCLGACAGHSGSFSLRLLCSGSVLVYADSTVPWLMQTVTPAASLCPGCSWVVPMLLPA